VIVLLIGFAIALALGYPLLIGTGVLYLDLLYNRAKVRRATETARSAIALGHSVDAVTELLLRFYKLPSMPTVRAISSAAEISVSDALTVVYPHLRRRQRSALAHWAPARLERTLDRFYPA